MMVVTRLDSVFQVEQTVQQGSNQSQVNNEQNIHMHTIKCGLFRLFCHTLDKEANSYRATRYKLKIFPQIARRRMTDLAGKQAHILSYITGIPIPAMLRTPLEFHTLPWSHTNF